MIDAGIVLRGKEDVGKIESMNLENAWPLPKNIFQVVRRAMGRAGMVAKMIVRRGYMASFLRLRLAVGYNHNSANMRTDILLWGRRFHQHSSPFPGGNSGNDFHEH